jgi:WD40 repeat protein/serine/threonine protein kinase
MFTPGTQIHQRYEVLEQVGMGGMGAVYKARDMRLKHMVAVKHMLMSHAPEHVRAFEREAQLLAHLHHSSLPKVTDYFVDQHGHFLVMHFVDGAELASLLTQHGRPFDLHKVLSWADTLLDTLMYLHSQEPVVIHRDIKPQNLKLTGRGAIMLLDFGLAKGELNQLAPATIGSVYGYTLQYSPIEQIKGLGTDLRSDLYSLAATLYHLLSGEPPPNAPTRTFAMLDESDPLIPLHERNPQVPPLVGEVLQRALALRQHDRFASAEEMRAALQPAIQLPAHRERPTYELGLVRLSGDQPKVSAPAVAPNHKALQVSPPLVQGHDSTTVAALEPEPIAEARGPALNPATPQPVRWGAMIAYALTTLIATGMLLIVFTPPLNRRDLAVHIVIAYLSVIGFLRLVAGKQMRHTTIVVDEHTDLVLSVAISPTGALLASASEGAAIHVMEMLDRSLLYRCSGHRGAVRQLCFTPDGTTLISASDDTTVRLWDTRDGAPLHTLCGHTARVWSVAAALNGQLLASASDDATARLWRLDDGTPLHTLQGHTASVWSVAFAPNGQTLASAGEDGSIRLWRTRDGICVAHLTGHASAVYSVAFSPDGQLLASGSGDTTVKLWRVADGKPLHKLQGHSLKVGGVIFHPEGKLLASRSEDATIQIWRVDDGTLVMTLQGHSSYISDIAFTPDGRFLASASWDATVRIWRVRDGQPLVCFDGHRARILDLAVTPDGQWLASTGLDRSVRLWQMP